MNWEKIKNNKALQVGLIIIVPTVIVLGYVGIQYARKKFGKIVIKRLPNGDINTTGMEYYRISTPFNAEITGKIYNAIINEAYVPVGEIVIDDKGIQKVDIEIMTYPEVYNDIKDILKKLGNNIEIINIKKEEVLTVPEKDVLEIPNEVVNEMKKAS
jgi:hypothetical protein